MIFYKNIGCIKALSFDLDDTLYDNVPVINLAEERFAKLLQERYRLPPEVANRNFWDEVRASVLRKRPECASDMSVLRQTCLTEGFAKLGRILSIDAAKKLTSEFVCIRSEIKVPISTFNLLGDLKKKYTLAAISNGNSDLQKSGLKPYFDFDLRPHIGGNRCKPYPDLFHDYAKVMSLHPKEILHIGDDPFTDVAGSVGAGCMCAWLEGGIVGKCVGSKALRVLPHIKLSSLEELRMFL